MKKSLLLMATLLLTLTPARAALGQSTDRDHPSALTSGELSGDLTSDEVEYFYSFTAGPGEVTLTVDVKSTDGTAGTNFELLDRDANKQLICCEFAQADTTGATGRDIKSVTLRARQTVVLHLTPFKYGKGTYRIRITGATEFAGSGGR